MASVARLCALLCLLQNVQYLNGRRIKYKSGSESLALTDVANKKKVTCTFEAINVEDMHPGDDTAEDDGFEWAECTDDEGVVHYVADDETTESIEQGSRVRLVLQEAPPEHSPELHAPWELEGKPFYEAVAVQLLDGSFIENKAEVIHTAGETKVMKVVSIVCNYNDHKVTYIDEQGIMDALYLTEDEFKASGKGGTYPGSMSDMIAKSSYGKVSLPRSEGTVVTIEMGSNWAGITNCPVNDIASTAKAKAKEQHPNVDWDKYHFYEYFIPNNPNGGCTWGGLASVGCGHYSRIGDGTCNAWYRTPQPFVRAHEIGHNLGFLHAGGDQRGTYVEYGDPEASMGASYRFSSFIASARYQCEFLEDKMGQVVTWQGQSAAQWRLQSLSLPLGVAGSDAVAIKFECSACTPRVSAHARIVGGNLWVQFRGDEGYSALKLYDQYQNKVYVHLARKYSHNRYGKGTEMWAKLDVGEHYETPDNRFVHVCSIVGDVAKVAVGSSLAQAEEQCGSDVVHTPAPTTPAPTLPPETDDCKDKSGSCGSPQDAGSWVGLGYCAASHQYHRYMMGNCKRSCNACETSQTPQPTNAATPRPTPRPATPQPTTPAPTEPPATPRPTAAPTSPPATDDCKNKRDDGHCASWQRAGYCNEGNKPDYRPFMLDNCKKACGVCTSTGDAYDAANCPFNKQVPATCWGDSAYQVCSVDRQGAYNSVMAKKPSMQAMHAEYLRLVDGKIGCTERQTPAPTTAAPTAAPTAQATEDASTQALKGILSDFQLDGDTKLVEGLIAWKSES